MKNFISFKERLEETEKSEDKIEIAIKHIEYLEDNLDKTISHSEYIAEILDKAINYSEYIAKNLDKTIAYAETIVEKLNKLFPNEQIKPFDDYMYDDTPKEKDTLELKPLIEMPDGKTISKYEFEKIVKEEVSDMIRGKKKDDDDHLYIKANTIDEEGPGSPELNNNI